jgi:hypothetical protein
MDWLHGRRSLAADVTGGVFVRAAALTRRLEVFVSFVVASRQVCEACDCLPAWMHASAGCVRRAVGGRACFCRASPLEQRGLPLPMACCLNRLLVLGSALPVRVGGGIGRGDKIAGSRSAPTTVRSLLRTRIETAFVAAVCLAILVESCSLFRL